MPNVTMGRRQGSGNNLQQGRLAAAVRSDYSDRRSGFDLEVDVAQGPEFFMTPQQAARDGFFQPIARALINPVLLGNFFDAQDHSHTLNVADVRKGKPEAEHRRQQAEDRMQK